jgi:hypothetical protein
MPSHEIKVIEYECAKCGHRRINRVNGKDGPKPTRCAKCKRWDWEEGYLSLNEKRLRSRLRDREGKWHTSSAYFGDLGRNSWCETTELYDKFVNIHPKPTIEEFETVIDPICYRSFEAEYPNNDDKHDENERLEKLARRQLMQHIIDSRLEVSFSP